MVVMSQIDREAEYLGFERVVCAREILTISTISCLRYTANVHGRTFTSSVHALRRVFVSMDVFAYTSNLLLYSCEPSLRLQCLCREILFLAVLSRDNVIGICLVDSARPCHGLCLRYTYHAASQRIINVPIV